MPARHRASTAARQPRSVTLVTESNPSLRLSIDQSVIHDPGIPRRRPALPDYTALARQPLRWVLPWGIVWALCGVALGSWSVLLDRAALAGRMLAPAAQAQVEISVERAFSGRDPGPTRLALLREPVARNGAPGTTPPLLPDAGAMEFEGSSFHLNLEALGAVDAYRSRLAGTVSWRHAQPDGGATRFWVCGYAQPAAGALLSPAQNRTTVAPELLPSTCRASR